MKNLVATAKNRVIKGIKSESGQLPDLGWQAGMLAVVVLVIVALAAFFPDAVVDMLETALEWAQRRIFS